MLKLTETQKNQTYEISLESNGIVVGSFVKIDGFFYYYPPKEKFWGAYVSTALCWFIILPTPSDCG